MNTAWRLFDDTAVTVPIAVLLLGFLIAAGQFRLAIGWTLVIIGRAGAVAALKLSLAVCGYPLAESGLRSPSGHTAMSIAVYGGMTTVISGTVNRSAHAVLIAAITTLTIGVALSRTIIGYHTPVEVVVGIVIGLAALLAIIAVVVHYRPENLSAPWLIAACLVLIALFYSTALASRTGHSTAGSVVRYTAPLV